MSMIPQHFDPVLGQPDYYQQNRQFLLDIIMKQLGLNESDLYKPNQEIKQIVREANINTIISN